MDKIRKNYKFTEEVLNKLTIITRTLNITETEAISRAIHTLYVQMTSEEQSVAGGAIVPLSEYQRIRDMLDQAILKAGELQGSLDATKKLIEEKEKQIAMKDEALSELKSKLKDAEIELKKYQAQLEELGKQIMILSTYPRNIKLYPAILISVFLATLISILIYFLLILQHSK